MSSSLEKLPLSTLIVDDDISFRKIVKIRLRSWRPNIELVEACSLSEARKAASEKGYQLVILDQNLPDGLGWQLLTEDIFNNSTVLAVSADQSPTLPNENLRRGADHFLSKRQVTEPLFIPLIEALLERRVLERELFTRELEKSKLATIKILLTTLRHEINNPLGAVIGGAYILKTRGSLDQEQLEALRLIEASSKRINVVLEKLCETAELEQINKASETVFKVPGDKQWE